PRQSTLLQHCADVLVLELDCAIRSSTEHRKQRPAMFRLPIRFLSQFRAQHLEVMIDCREDLGIRPVLAGQYPVVCLLNAVVHLLSFYKLCRHPKFKQLSYSRYDQLVGDRIRRRCPNLTAARNLLARMNTAIAAGTWEEFRKELTEKPKEELTISQLADIYFH